jgi:iron(III) transport system ATP-binding protein
MPTTGETPYLRIQNVTKKFGGFTALHSISLDIAEGEFICFLGPSGCGKTTLLRAIAGLDIQTSGRIIQGSRDISALPPSQRDFGIVFQSYALFPNLTVHKNVAYGLANRGMRRVDIDRRVHELLAMVGLPDQAPKYPSQLSGGQQQRIALARALAPSPGLLLLDEPLSALDAKVRIHLRNEIKVLQRRLGITTVMVTHDQDEALSMADRIVVMNHGVIAQVGPPTEVYRYPNSAFVANFIGTMNLLDGRVTAKGKVCCGTLEFTCDGDEAPVGASVTVAIRPEDVTLDAGDDCGGNVITVRVVSLDFLGSISRASFDAGTDTGVVFRADIPTNLARRLEIDPGKWLNIRLPKEHLRVYPGGAMHGDNGS